MSRSHPSTPGHIPETAIAAEIRGVGSDFGGTVRLPGSKSITNRILLVASLASGSSRLENVLACDDSLYMIDALRALGVTVDVDPSAGLDAPNPVLTVRRTDGGGAFPVKEGRFFFGNAGTTTRFLTAALAASRGRYVVDGDDRMRARPIADLIRALTTLGADVRAPSGCPPVEIGPGRWDGGDVDISGRVSSQFISAVLMAAPLASSRVRVRVSGELVSRPYIDLTVQGMRDFGARVWVYDKTDDGLPIFEIDPTRGYVGAHHVIEGDASAASYFWAAAALTGSTIRVEGIGKETVQGDLRCSEVLAEMGCRVTKERDAVQVVGGLLRGIDCDCADIPDVVPTLAVVALFARGKTRLRGVPHLRHKESDRIASVASELRKIGGQVRELPDGLEIGGTSGKQDPHFTGAEIETWGDHRIAMAFAIAGLAIPGIVVARPQVVSKSFPSFFQALAGIGANVTFRQADGTTLDLTPERRLP
jgi:3-phosphoshikimate 1-carboxyvinyltransferase